MKTSTIQSVVAEAAKELRSIQPTPPFPYLVEWSDGYEQLLRGRYAKTGDIHSLLVEGQERGRVIIHAEGGAGKSTVIRQLFIVAADEGWIPILVNLRLWQQSTYRLWEETRGNPDVALQTLVRDMGVPQVSETDLGSLPGDRRMIILVDGLNEIPPPAGATVLRALEAYAQRYPSNAVVVADRLVRRDLPSDRWALAHVRVDVNAARDQYPETL